MGDVVTLLYLVRHAEQEHTPDEDPSAGLSPTGRRQAQLLGQRLRRVPFDGIHHSPLKRAEETAHLVAATLPGVPVDSTALLSDRTPVPSPEQEAAYSARDLAWLATVPAAERDEDGAEISSAMRHFVQLGAEARTPQGRPRPSHQLLITHAFVISWLVREALEAPTRRWLSLNPFNCGLTVIDCRPEQPPTLITFNDVGHLPLELRGRTPRDLLA